MSIRNSMLLVLHSCSVGMKYTYSYCCWFNVEFRSMITVHTCMLESDNHIVNLRMYMVLILYRILCRYHCYLLLAWYHDKFDFLWSICDMPRFARYVHNTCYYVSYYSLSCLQHYLLDHRGFTGLGLVFFFCYPLTCSALLVTSLVSLLSSARTMFTLECHL